MRWSHPPQLLLHGVPGAHDAVQGPLLPPAGAQGGVGRVANGQRGEGGGGGGGGDEEQLGSSETQNGVLS